MLLPQRAATFCTALVLSALSGVAGAEVPRMDGLLAINDAASPCISVRVQVFEEGQPFAEVAVMPDGKVNPVGQKGIPTPRFAKGKSYKLQATCVSTANVYQNSELSFKAEGRTVMVVFTKSGFQFKRGGLAY